MVQRRRDESKFLRGRHLHKDYQHLPIWDVRAEVLSGKASKFRQCRRHRNIKAIPKGRGILHFLFLVVPELMRGSRVGA